MPNTREVKTRLRGVRKTQQITRAMKMVATVKLRHAQAALANSRPYAERMFSLAAELLSRIERPPDDNPFFTRRAITQATPRREKILMVVVAADRGLCGSMNANVFRLVLRSIDDLVAKARNAAKPEIDLLLVGRKSKDFFSAQQNMRPRDLPYRVREAAPFDGLDPAALASRCCEFYRAKEYDRIDLFYNELFSSLQHRPAVATLFPLDFAQMRAQAAGPAGNVIFEPDVVAMLDDVICGYAAARVRKIILEAAVAEHTARMLMMDLATKNADDLITAMQMTMNKLRQLLITNELADITTGAEAIA